MAELFDIEFVTTHFGTCDLAHYLGLLERAPTRDLHLFRRKVHAHSKLARKSKAFSNTPNLSCHSAIIAAIDYQLLKRSRIRSSFHAFFFPLRRLVVFILTGNELKQHKAFGEICLTPNHSRSLWHMSDREISNSLKRFLYEFRKELVTAVLAIITAVIIAKILNK